MRATIAAMVTITSLAPLIAPLLAMTFVVPGLTPDNIPLGLTTPTDGADVFQVTEDVRSRVLASLYLPVAVNCCAVPALIFAFPGATRIAVRLA